MFQDIKNPKRSLKDVLPKKGRSRQESEPEAESETEAEASESPRFAPPRPRHRRRRRLSFFWPLLLLIILGVGGFFASNLFASVRVEVMPKQTEVTIERESFKVAFESVNLPVVSETRRAVAGAVVPVEKKASGRVTIYNAYSSAPQTLIANTRFENNGKIYRINQGVTVPGSKTSAGKTVPGSVEAVVTADKPGAEYNLSSGEFTIPGFKGTPRYAKFSAEVKTPITGGFSGKSPSVSEADQIKLRSELEEVLRQKLADQANFQIPDDFILYPSAVVATFEQEIKPVAGKDKEADFTLTAKARGIMFDRETLSRALVAKKVPDFAERPFKITNLESLVFELDRNSVSEGNKEASVTVSGRAHVELTVDQESLAQKLLGVKKKEAEAVFEQFPAIGEARVSFRPPWIFKFPADSSKLNITLTSSVPDLTE